MISLLTYECVKNNIMKVSKLIKICVSISLSVILLFGFSTTLDARNVNQSCAAGGEMYVCGSAQILQATSDFDTNCEGWDYTPCTILRVIIDVCSPDMREAQIFEEGGSNCPLNNL